MLTLSNNSHFPPEWFFAKLEKLSNLFASRHGYRMEWAASVELTKNGVNHCHALVRFPGAPPTWFESQSLKCGSPVFPSDWQQRQKAKSLDGRRKMVSFIYRKVCPDTHVRPQVAASKEGLVMLREALVKPLEYLCFWYQGNYGAIAQCDPIRNQSSVVSYALKYATKEITHQSIRWMISSGATPTAGTISDDTLPLRSQPPRKRCSTSRSDPPWR